VGLGLSRGIVTAAVRAAAQLAVMALVIAWVPRAWGLTAGFRPMGVYKKGLLDEGARSVVGRGFGEPGDWFLVFVRLEGVDEVDGVVFVEMDDDP